MHIKRKGLTLRIFKDDIESPREYYKDENISKMICFSKKYDLGDEHSFKTPSEFKKWYENNIEEMAFIEPLYLYDHSGISISTVDYKDPWDSGQIGYVYVPIKEAENKGYQNLSEIKNRVTDEVLEYDNWLSGYPEYYSFEITNENDELIESAGVFECDNFKKMIIAMKERINSEYSFLFDELYKKENESYL